MEEGSRLTDKVEIPSGFQNARLIKTDGSMKDVYKAFDVSSKSWKILKRFRESPSEEMLQEEMRPLARLKHPNIVVQDHPRHLGDETWVIEEILDETFDDLAPLNHKYGISVYGGQIADALAYLHNPINHGGKAMVHGDIHMKNCGLVRGVAKLFDFGKATYANSEVRKGKGYICTRAPEQFSDTAKVTTNLDIWAFGCTLYGLRTAEYPFITREELAAHRNADEKGQDEMARLIASRAEQGLSCDTALRLRSKFDEELWAVIDQMVVADAASRISADEVVSLLTEYRETIQIFSLSEQADISHNLATQASESIARGDVRKLDWFEKLVRTEVGEKT